MEPVKLCECGCGRPAPIATESWQRWGHVAGQPMRFIRGHNNRAKMSSYQRVMARCERVDSCLVMRSGGGDRYASISVNGRQALAHRIVYEHHFGPIPNGYHIDHVKARGCRSTRCCDIAHLEAVSPAENIRRSGCVSAVNARKTHCRRGHPLSGDNVRTKRRKGRIERVCRTCAAMLMRQIRARAAERARQ